ncbi:hypothetical protein [Candidatus Methanomassiliicoccus intestinalis]|uniref:hypothetical protein n=1 Tax=Candidatus Methanomassiliicoccus intestinalis TaxID=1406512 RepID=UPI0037DDCEEF
MAPIRIYIGYTCHEFSDRTECLFHKDGICVLESLYTDPVKCVFHKCRFQVNDDILEGGD